LTVRRTTRDKRQRREQLLEAAERVFGRTPFDEATMQQVAAEARIGMQGLYALFPSKQKLYEGVILSRVQAFQRQVEETLASIDDPLERLATWATLKTERIRESPAYFPLYLRERINYDWNLKSRFGETLRKIYDVEERRVGSIMADCIQRGLIPPVEAAFAVHLWLEVLHASMYFHIRHDPDEEVATCVRRALDCFLRGVAARRQP
jgi:AcrR family transcriptional regulator